MSEWEYATLRYPHGQPGGRQEAQRTIEKLLEIEQAENRRLRHQLESERRIHAAKMAQLWESLAPKSAPQRHRPIGAAMLLGGDISGEIVGRSS
jgi:hypothetical protein